MREVRGITALLWLHALILCGVLGICGKNHADIVGIGRVVADQSGVHTLVHVGRFFHILEASLLSAHTMSQSHMHKIMCYLSAVYRYQISSISLVIVEFQRCPGLLPVTRSTADSSKNMPITVSLQPKKKKEKRLIQHAVLVVSMRLLIRQSSLCDPVTWFYETRV